MDIAWISDGNKGFARNFRQDKGCGDFNDSGTTEKHRNEKYCYYVQLQDFNEGDKIRRISINGALFIFMKRGEKLTHDAICNDAWRPQNRYLLWPRG